MGVSRRGSGRVQVQQAQQGSSTSNLQEDNIDAEDEHNR